jgi:HEAT repeat protein
VPAARGLALLNVINTLADRRDMESVEAISKLAASEDAQAADAAVAALGRIGGESAAKRLAEIRKKGEAKARLAATLAYLQCAEGLATQGRKEQAAAIYEELFKPGEPKLIRRGALVGTLALGGDRAVNGLMAVLGAGDAELRAVAIAQVQTLKADEVGERLSRELPKLPPADQALLLSAMV